jgi:hypothetical protein
MFDCHHLDFYFSYVLQLQPRFSLEGDEGSYFSAAQRLYLQLKPDDARPLLISAISGFRSYLAFPIFIFSNGS